MEFIMVLGGCRIYVPLIIPILPKLTPDVHLCQHNQINIFEKIKTNR